MAYTSGVLRSISVMQYLGSVIVVRVRGTQSTEEACLRLRVSWRSNLQYSIPKSPFSIPQTSTENMQKLPDIILSICWKGVKFVDGQSKVRMEGVWGAPGSVTDDLVPPQMVVSTHAIQDISYCSKV